MTWVLFHGKMWKHALKRVPTPTLADL